MWEGWKKFNLSRDFLKGRERYPAANKKVAANCLEVEALLHAQMFRGCCRCSLGLPGSSWLGAGELPPNMSHWHYKALRRHQPMMHPWHLLRAEGHREKPCSETWGLAKQRQPYSTAHNARHSNSCSFCPLCTKQGHECVSQAVPNCVQDIQLSSHCYYPAP